MSPGDAVRGVIVGSGLVGARVWRTPLAPRGATLPWAEYLDPLANPVALSGDGQTLARTRRMSVEVWQSATVGGDGIVPALVELLDGIVLDSEPANYRCKVLGWQYVPDPNQALLHHSVDLEATVTR